jgi:hypothetical protein
MVAVAERACHGRTAEQPIALKAEEQLRDTTRRLGPDDAAADAERREVRLVPGALGELRGTFDQALGIEGGADDGLGIQVRNGTLLLLRPTFGFSVAREDSSARRRRC